MILAHSIIGIMPVSNSEFSWFWLIGSVVADIDHIFVLYKYKIFSYAKIVDIMRFEDRNGIHFKTKYMHSIFGAVVTTVPVFLISKEGALYYFIAYIIHLIIDWPDTDEKQYLYPFKKKFKGFLPILSKTEIVFTTLLLIFYFAL